MTETELWWAVAVVSLFFWTLSLLLILGVLRRIEAKVDALSRKEDAP